MGFTQRISATAPCVALPPASMQSLALRPSGGLRPLKIVPDDFLNPVASNLHPLRHNKKAHTLSGMSSSIVAERVGFEPTKGYKPLPVFKTGAFNRSATSPKTNHVLVNHLVHHRPGLPVHYSVHLYCCTSLALPSASVQLPVLYNSGANSIRALSN